MKKISSYLSAPPPLAKVKQKITQNLFERQPTQANAPALPNGAEVYQNSNDSGLFFPDRGFYVGVISFEMGGLLSKYRKLFKIYAAPNDLQDSKGRRRLFKFRELEEALEKTTLLGHSALYFYAWSEFQKFLSNKNKYTGEWILPSREILANYILNPDVNSRFAHTLAMDPDVDGNGCIYWSNEINAGDRRMVALAPQVPEDRHTELLTFEKFSCRLCRLEPVN